MMPKNIIGLIFAMGASVFPLAAQTQTQPLNPIVVTAPRDADDYDGASAPIGLLGKSLWETPASGTIVSRRLMDDQGARGVLRVIGNDASIGENYSPLGYYESLSIRGFTLDNASGYKRNGLTIANESSMPLENKERVEMLKGVAGFDAGMAVPGGVINYATKQPPAETLRQVTLELSDQGTRYGHVDLGGRLGQFGYRINAAREDYHPYVTAATGSRDFLSAVLDWRVNDHLIIALDADWQKKSQLSVPGYQALGGVALPPGVSPEKMLNNQSWSTPVAIESANLGGRVSYAFDSGMHLDASVNRNRVAAEDNAAFPYGCSSGPTYSSTFCGNGDYDLYDYRSSGEVRAVTHAQARLSASADWAGMRHEWMGGLSNFERTVNVGSEVYEYVGTDNIYNPNPLSFSPSPLNSGAVYRTQNYAERALFASDLMTIAPGWKVNAGLRASDVLDDHFSKLDGAAQTQYRRSFFSPQLALMFFARPSLMSYAAYSQGLELGGTAAVTTANAGQIMNPKVSRQIEVGVKSDSVKGVFLAAAIFHIWKPYEFINPDNVFVQQGTLQHSGVEFSAAGHVAQGLRLFASTTLLHARQTGTGVAEFDGQAPVNVPWLRSQATLDWELPWMNGVGMNGTWAHVADKYAVRDNSLKVPGYNTVDLGVRYTLRLGASRIIWRGRVENVLNVLYWKDVGEYFGDGYLHLGAPRTFKLTGQINF